MIAAGGAHPALVGACASLNLQTNDVTVIQQQHCEARTRRSKFQVSHSDLEPSYSNDQYTLKTHPPLRGSCQSSLCFGWCTLVIIRITAAASHRHILLPGAALRQQKRAKITSHGRKTAVYGLLEEAVPDRQTVT
jgi:hypothetical protein